MPETRLERTRRSYDLVIDLWPMGCKIVEVGTQDTKALNDLWKRIDSTVTANVIEGEHFASDAERHPVTEGSES